MTTDSAVVAAADAMARAHTDLNVFAAVRALMENSLISPDDHARKAEGLIVGICKRAEARAFLRYERAEKLLAARAKETPDD